MFRAKAPLQQSFQDGDRGTEGHPIWSNDRLDWVPLSELKESESVQAQGGYAKVQRIQETEDIEKVYTLEVDADHCYRVGQQGLLVHNMSAIPMGDGPCERKYPTQTCTNMRLDELEGQKNATCNNMAGQSCTGQSPKKLAKIPCPDIIARINAILACMAIRDQIRNECFGGVDDAGHAQAYQQLVNGLAKCRALAMDNCPAGTTIP